MDRIDQFPSHEQLHPCQNQQQEASYLAVWEERRNRIINILKKQNCRHILDLGCGEGRLFQAMKFMPEFKRMIGIDIDIDEISKSFGRVGPITYHMFNDDPPEEPLEVTLYCGDLTIPYPSLLKECSDAITMVEVIEHLPADVLERLPFALFGFYRPEIIVISTPNQEYNQCIKGFDLNTFRHDDHKFEWTRKEFQTWCETQIKKFGGYGVSYQTVGRIHSNAEEDFFDVTKHGRCTQIAVFKRIPGAMGPYSGDLECFDEFSLEKLKNFKFPSKQEIENLKISPDWDYDLNQEFDHYQYSEDNTELGDQVDPEWWKVVWNKVDDNENIGKGNGQGWDDDDEEPLLYGWLSDDSCSQEFREKSKSDCSPAENITFNKQKVDDWQCEGLWAEEKLNNSRYPQPCSPSSSSSVWTDEEVSSEEDLAELCINKDAHLQAEPYPSGRLLTVSNSRHFENTQKWDYEVESKTLERCKRDLWLHKGVMQKMFGTLDFSTCVGTEE